MLLISPVQLAIQYFILGEMIGFSPKMETFLDFLHIELFLLIIYMIFDLWKNVKQTKGTKLLWSVALLFYIPSFSVLFYFWFYLDKTRLK